jgi:uncharacterized protein (TIGR03000 family)
MSSRKRFCFYWFSALVLAIGILLLFIDVSPAGQPWWPGNSSSWPWEKRPKIHGYDENRPNTPPPPTVTRPAMKYTITITVSPPEPEKENPDIALVVAHLPEDALLWIGGYQTKQRGMLRHFESPPLKQSAKYVYAVRVVWYEDGQWVSETKELPVQAGASSCLFLSKTSAVETALAEFAPDDRKAAQQQRFCAVQSANELGSMGKPVKVVIKGESVFLCCEDCHQKAIAEPDKTIAKAKELKSKNRSSTRK